MVRVPRNQEQIEHDLHKLGIESGDTLVLHSSLRSIGPVMGGAKAVINAALTVLGKSGLLVAPAYTYSTSWFDPATDESRTGWVTETMRTWPGAVRSWHPTHSVVAIGRDAVALTEGHHLIAACGHGSPLDRAAARNGWVLLIGCAHNQNSTIHVGEVHANTPYLDIPFSPDSFVEATVVTPDGEIDVPIIFPSGCSKGFGAIERPLRERGAIRDGFVGDAIVQLMRGSDVIEVAAEMLTDDAASLLCSDPNCYRCTQSRKAVSEKVFAQ